MLYIPNKFTNEDFPLENSKWKWVPRRNWQPIGSSLNVLTRTYFQLESVTYVLNQIKSNQILFKVVNVHLKEMKISKKLFTQLYSITNNNKLYIWLKYFGTSLWNRTWPQMKINFSEF